ncbi:hypothetical protein GCM10010358_43470 [Streptomyces minutiscleroticus]|uniref:Uncharacterized protein n=1 Tax=Streptomyces minutiscleroticus TaxID=68238 RepID=A0A918U391_9ACTN|nr:hypothetical protein GCM10010358_43470 [Streptomyces minutiscleroticus]
MTDSKDDHRIGRRRLPSGPRPRRGARAYDRRRRPPTAGRGPLPDRYTCTTPHPHDSGRSM